MYIIWFAGLKKELEAGDKKAVESGESCLSWCQPGDGDMRLGASADRLTKVREKRLDWG